MSRQPKQPVKVPLELPWIPLLILAAVFLFGAVVIGDPVETFSIDSTTDASVLGYGASTAPVEASVVESNSAGTTRPQLVAAAVATSTATRSTAAPLPSPPATGLHGLPFAPAGLTGCDEVAFYRHQFGLPDRFDGLAFRESTCRNDVSSYCCHGWFQLYVDVHLTDHRLAPLYAACGIDDVDDVLGDSPLAKQRNVCGAAAVYEIQGGSAWDAW